MKVKERNGKEKKGKERMIFMKYLNQHKQKQLRHRITNFGVDGQVQGINIHTQ